MVDPWILLYFQVAMPKKRVLESLKSCLAYDDRWNKLVQEIVQVFTMPVPRIQESIHMFWNFWHVPICKDITTWIETDCFCEDSLNMWMEYHSHAVLLSPKTSYTLHGSSLQTGEYYKIFFPHQHDIDHELNRILSNELSLRIPVSSLLMGHGTTGLSLWEGSIYLSKYIQYHVSQFRDKSILELGSGLGLGSLMAASIGLAKQVIITDGHPVVYHRCKQILQDNLCFINRVRQEHSIQHTDIVQVRQLYWYLDTEPECHDDLRSLPPIDLIIASDTIYDPDLHIRFLHTIRRIISGNSQDCSILLCITSRNETTVEAFFKESSKIFPFHRWEVVISDQLNDWMSSVFYLTESSRSSIHRLIPVN